MSIKQKREYIYCSACLEAFCVLYAVAVGVGWGQSWRAGQAGAGKAGQAATEQVRSRLASQPAFTRCVPAGNTLRRVNTLCISAHRAAERYVYPLLFSEGRDDL